MNQSLNYSRVYPFTNENLMSYKDFIDFTDKRVLSVVGSGDQYFSFLLFGSKDIDLFDINNVTRFYFVLKFYSIMILDYEEFKNFFVSSKLDNLDLYNKVSYYLPKDVRNFFDLVLSKGRELSSLIFKVSLNCNPINYSTNRVVPYFDRDMYYQLQDILRSVSLPNIYSCSLEDLSEVISGNYDFISLSNVYLYLTMNIKEFRSFLDYYLDCLNSNGIIQAYYTWSRTDKFFGYDFERREVPSVRVVSDRDFKDYVFTLRKK